jgi:hypothetical protein
MKKCLLMFALLLMTLILAMVTEGKKEIVLDQRLTVDNNLKKEMLFDQKSVEPTFKKID